MKKLFYITIVVLIVIAFALFFSSPLSYALAQISGLSIPFGGRVLTSIPCTCSGTTLLIVGPPKGGSFILTPFSKTYRNYKPFPPNWVLGLATGSAVCLVGAPPLCVPAGKGPIITIIGTS